MNSPQRAVPVRDRFYARTFALLTALVLGIALFKIVQPFLGPLLWAMFIAFLLHPLHVRLTRRLKGRAQLSAALLTVLTLIVLLGPLAALSAAFAAQVGDLLQTVQSTVADQTESNVFDLTNVPWVQRRRSAGSTALSASTSRRCAAGSSRARAQCCSRSLRSAARCSSARSAPSFGFVLMVFMLFFFIRDGEEMVATAARADPDVAGIQRTKLFDHLAAVTRAMVYGTGLTALIQGTLVGIAFLIVGLPSPLVFGVIAALAALLPFGGTALVWIPAAIVLAAQGRWGATAFMVVWGALLVSLVDNVVRPMLVAGRAPVGTLTVFIGVLGGIAAFGAIGLFLGPVVLALIIALHPVHARDPRRAEAADRRPSTHAMSDLSQPLRIATRQSRLALWQARARRRAGCATAHPGLAVELVPMTTQGDRILDRSLAEVGGKGLFIKELELAIAEGRADIAVHSMKDVPSDLPPGMTLAAMLPRADPRDAFVSLRHASFSALPQGARVGTSSLRRQCQLKYARPDLRAAHAARQRRHAPAQAR